jgi:hypothetical protein
VVKRRLKVRKKYAQRIAEMEGIFRKRNADIATSYRFFIR